MKRTTPKPASPLLATAKQLAEHLPGWTPAAPLTGYDHRQRAYLFAPGEAAALNDEGCPIDQGGRYVWLHTVYNQPGRFEVSGNWPKGAESNNYYSPSDRRSATFSADRNPEKLARDLERRYLSWYLAEYAQLAAQAEADKVRYFERECELERLINATGLPEESVWCPDRQRDFDGQLRNRREFKFATRHGRARCSGKLGGYRNEVTLELDLDSDDAAAVLRLLAKRGAFEPGVKEDEED